MKCPIMVNEYGNSSQCTEDKCAWWDIGKKQCCIKTHCLNSFKGDVLQAIEMLKNHSFAMNELERIIERM